MCPFLPSLSLSMCVYVYYICVYVYVICDIYHIYDIWGFRELKLSKILNILTYQKILLCCILWLKTNILHGLHESPLSWAHYFLLLFSYDISMHFNMSNSFA